MLGWKISSEANSLKIGSHVTSSLKIGYFVAKHGKLTNLKWNEVNELNISTHQFLQGRGWYTIANYLLKKQDFNFPLHHVMDYLTIFSKCPYWKTGFGITSPRLPKIVSLPYPEVAYQWSTRNCYNWWWMKVYYGSQKNTSKDLPSKKNESTLLNFTKISPTKIQGLKNTHVPNKKRKKNETPNSTPRCFLDCSPTPSSPVAHSLG